MPVIPKVTQHFELKSAAVSHTLSLNPEDDTKNHTGAFLIEDEYAAYEREMFTVQQDMFLVKSRCYTPQISWKQVKSDFLSKFSIDRSLTKLQERMENLLSESLQSIFQLYIKYINGMPTTNALLLPEYLHMLEHKHSWKPSEECTTHEATLLDGEIIDIYISTGVKKVIRLLPIVDKKLICGLV